MTANTTIKSGKIDRNRYRVLIVKDDQFDPFDMAEELQADYGKGLYHAYEVIVEERNNRALPGLAHGQTRWDELGSIWGVLLDQDDWAGEYTLDALDAQSPGPYANHVNEIVNDILTGR